MDKCEEIEKRLDSPEIKSSKSLDTVLHWVEKLVLPAALGILTFFVAQGTQKISEGQLAIAKAQYQLKYLELFYKDISDLKQPDRQKAALTLLYVTDREVGDVLAKAVAANESNTQEVRISAATLGKKINMLGPLVNYEVIFYYVEGDDKARELAESYAKRLTLFELITCRTEKLTRDHWHNKLQSPKRFEIRYDDIFEEEAAEALAKLLGGFDRNISFRKVVAGGRTPFKLTVFF